MNEFMVKLHTAIMVRCQRPRDERGDVPGWVMVTVMTAGVIAVLFPILSGQLETLIDGAMKTVVGGTKKE